MSIKKICWVKLALCDTIFLTVVYECGALWILQSITILYEPAHEITILVGMSCNEGSNEPAKMRMLVRVPPKDQGELSKTKTRE